MAEGSELPAPPPPPPPLPPPASLKGLREQMVAAAQALAEERRNQSNISPVALPSHISTKAKPVIDGSMLKSEERQRLARERRQEREKQYAARETQILEKEKKAKLQYERQVEEKQRKLKEQKLKDQQRRAAVEEKRKQKIEEEKEHYEAVMHRTLERSQRLETRQKRWSWSGYIGDPNGKAEPVAVAEANNRSVSAANLKQSHSLIHKHLSSSTAFLSSPSKGSAKRSSSLNRLNNKSSVSSEQPGPKSLLMEQKGETEKKRSSSLNRMSSTLFDLENEQKEEKAARRLVIPLESHGISRLLTPTQASLARSKSAATLSADGKDPLAINTSANSPAHLTKVPMRSRSTDRLKGTASLSENPSLESRQKPEAGKQALPSIGKSAPSPAPRRPLSPSNVGKRPPSPAAIRQRPLPVSASSIRQQPAMPTAVPKPAPIQRPSLTPNVLTLTKKRASQESTPKERTEDALGQEQGAALHPAERETAAGLSKAKEDASCKTVPGTTTAEEAARILAEKRRLAREQREREEQEKIQREERERLRKEAEAQRALEEQARVEEALRELEALRRAEEEEQQRLAEEERVRREQEAQEKLAELQLQREEAEARASEEAERQRQERERIMQQNLQERMERKKRIEEIMKRTRKAEQNDMKNEGKLNEEEDEGVEEEELGLEKQDQPEKANYGDLSLDDGPEALHNFTLVQEDSETGADLVFVVNGKKQEEVDQRNKDGDSVYFTQSVEARIPPKETLFEDSEILHVNEADNSAGFISNLNGKSPAWNFEEILDLGVHPVTIRLSSESTPADSQNFRDGLTVPTSPKLAFEEESAANSLTKPFETQNCEYSNPGKLLAAEQEDGGS